jgi:hypothetical protein
VRQLTVPITYKGTRLRSSYRVDLIVEDNVVVEVKSVVSSISSVVRGSIHEWNHPPANALLITLILLTKSALQ